MVTISYPSQDFPAPLPIALDIPHGWVALHVPDMLISARSPDAHDGFRPSVTVGWQRVPPGAEPGSFVEQMAAVGGAALSDYQLLETKAGEKGSVAVAASRQRFDSDGGVPTFQETLFVLGPETTERTRDLFQVTATRHEADEANADVLTEILNSFTILDLTGASASAEESPST
jgi:hypothetical protein